MEYDITPAGGGWGTPTFWNANLLVLAHCVLFVTQARAALIGGVEFPQGTISFADSVVSCTPIFVSGDPAPPYREPANALGGPD